MTKNSAPKEAQMPTQTSIKTPATGWMPIHIRPMRVLLKQMASGNWVGHCLDHNLPVQGENPKAVTQILTDVLATQCLIDQSEGRIPLSTLGQAPQEFWDAYQNGSRLSFEEHHVHLMTDVACNEGIAVQFDCAIATV